MVGSETKSLVAIAEVRVKSGTETQFALAAKKILPLVRQEDGNILYLFHQAEDDPTCFVFYEQWNDEHALKLHAESPHMQAFRKEIGRCLMPGYPKLEKFRLII